MKKLNVKGAVLRVAATGAGAVGAASLNKIAFMQKQKAAVRGAIKIAIGAFVPGFLAKGKKSEVFENVGNGMIAVGALELANATAFKSAPLVISGVPTLGSVERVYVQSNSPLSGANSSDNTLL